MLKIRKAETEDAEALIELYMRHLTADPPAEEQDPEKWRAMIQKFRDNPFYHLLVGEADGTVVSSVTLVIVENLTHNNRPYALIENVVTHAEHRGKHYAAKLMDYASETAKKMDCYKIMLLTGSKKEATLRFYENCGFERKTKTAFYKKL